MASISGREDPVDEERDKKLLESLLSFHSLSFRFVPFSTLYTRLIQQRKSMFIFSVYMFSSIGYRKHIYALCFHVSTFFFLQQSRSRYSILSSKIAYKKCIAAAPWIMKRH
jgi:hypothetical protein